MTTISAALVMQLRQRSGAGMMDCKKVLIATGGDIEQAIIELRKSGQAGKKAGRIAAEGIVVIAQAADKRMAVMVEINSETDFAARAENFRSFANNVATTALKTGVNDIDALSNVQLLGSDVSIEQARQELVAVIGENIQLRRLVRIEVEAGVVGCYLHGSRIGVLVAMKQILLCTLQQAVLWLLIVIKYLLRRLKRNVIFLQHKRVKVVSHKRLLTK